MSFGGGRNNNRGGGRGWGKGNGRGGRGGRGRGRNNNNRGYNTGNNNNNSQQGKLNPCRNFTRPNSSCNNSKCTFSHSFKCHASIDAVKSRNTGGYQDQKKDQTTNACALWESPNGIKIFTGGKDGFWRLWNTANNFSLEFEQEMGNNVTKLEVFAGFLFCAFEAVGKALPEVPVGMVHVWNLSNPADAPLEFQMDPQFAPYAHGSTVSAMLVTSAVEGSTDPSKMVIATGDKSGIIRLWNPPSSQDQKVFSLQQTFYGHAGEVTGLVICNNFLWSSGIDGSIRMWDPLSGQCKYLLSSTSPDMHTDAVTDLILWQDQGSTYVLSSSLDGTVKAWSSDGKLMISEKNYEGVICISTNSDPAGKQVLVCGLISGNVSIRSLTQSHDMPAFTLIATLAERYSVGHTKCVRCLCSGPSYTFYSGGDDGKALVFQIVGALS